MAMLRALERPRPPACAGVTHTPVNKARATPPAMTQSASVKTREPSLPEVNFSDHGDVRYLHLGTEWVQGSMDLRKPYEIHLDYVQRMMAWLLFADADSVAKRHAMQLG